MFFKNTEVVPMEQIATGPLAPPHDATLMERMESVYRGELPMYQALAPLDRVKPRHADFHPELTPMGAEILRQLEAQLKSAVQAGEMQDLPRVLVYVEGDSYISSDDYFTLCACRNVGISRVPCFVLGEPTIDGTAEVRGPAPIEAARRVLAAG